MIVDRARFRAYALDGATLYFHPATGTSVRVATAATRDLRRTAPRVAMFGITNACNLSCEFCSRDVRRDSAWTVASAAAALRGLAEAGTLEVAFGGGEPFAFRGFGELIGELHATTPLALNVTTNGTLIDAKRWQQVRGRLGQVRISIYRDQRPSRNVGLLSIDSPDEERRTNLVRKRSPPRTAAEPWRAAAELLAGDRQRWGANVLVDREELAELPGLLAELAELACHDVSLLAYVGADRARQLDRDDDARLAAIIRDSPLPCRISVCFGARLAVPRLFADDDCGAGYDFVAITPDRRVQACSFQDHAMPGATADVILGAWRTQQARLAQPSPRRGCARVLPLAKTSPPPIAIWQAFSGNNSGECILVARFEATADAEKFLAELLPGFAPDAPYAPDWKRLFADERIGVATVDAADDTIDGVRMPEELARVGRCVVALGYEAGDMFTDLRALAWKRGAFVAPGGVHAHEPTVLAAIRARDRDDARRIADTALHPSARAYIHGDVALFVAPLKHNDGIADLATLEAALAELAGDRPTAIEIFDEPVDDAELIRVKQQLGHPLPARRRLFAWFYGSADDARNAAQRLAAALALPDDGAVALANGVLIDPIGDPNRLAVLAHRHGARVRVLDGLTVRIVAQYWHTPPRDKRAQTPKLDQPAIAGAITAVLAHDTVTTTDGPTWNRAVTVTVDTSAPRHALAALAVEADTRACNLRVWLADLDPLAWALRRVLVSW